MSPTDPTRAAARSGGLVFAGTSAAAFAMSGPLAGSLLDAGWTPLAAVIARIAVGALVLSLPAYLVLRGRWSLLRRGGPAALAYGLLGVAAAQLFFFNALQYVPVGVALLLEYLGILLVVAWQWLRRGQRPGPLTSVGAVVALIGLATVLDLGGAGAPHPLGVLWGLGAAVGLAAYFVVAAELPDEVPPLAMTWAGMVVAVGVLVGAAALGVLPVGWSQAPVDLAGASLPWWTSLLGLGVLAGALAYGLGVAAVRALGARTASFVGLIEVVFAAVFAWLLLGESLTANQAVGGAVIITGVVLVRAADLRAARTAAATEPQLAM